MEPVRRESCRQAKAVNCTPPALFDLDEINADLNRGVDRSAPTDAPEVTHHGTAHAVACHAPATHIGHDRLPPLDIKVVSSAAMDDSDEWRKTTTTTDRYRDYARVARNVPARRLNITSTTTNRANCINARSDRRPRNSGRKYGRTDRWIKGAPKTKYLYGMRELLAAPPDVPIWITEGEKDRNTLAGLDLVAVTNPGGAGKWNKDFTPAQIERWFKGRKTAYLLEDNDAPGRKHVEIIGRTLQSLVADIRVVTFRELAEKSDVTDWLVEQGHTKEELLARAAAAPKYRPPALQSVNAADVTMVAVEWLWPNRFALGKLGIIAGLPDEGKGLLLSYIAAQVTNGGAWPLNEGVARARQRDAVHRRR